MDGLASRHKIQLLPTHVLCVLLISGIFSASVVFAQIQFEDVSTATGIAFAGRENGSAWGDFNGDGVLDILLRYESKGAVSVLIGNGNGSFQAGTSYAVGNTMTSLLLVLTCSSKYLKPSSKEAFKKQF